MILIANLHFFSLLFEEAFEILAFNSKPVSKIIELKYIQSKIISQGSNRTINFDCIVKNSGYNNLRSDRGNK